MLPSCPMGSVGAGLWKLWMSSGIPGACMYALAAWNAVSSGASTADGLDGSKPLDVGISSTVEGWDGSNGMDF